MNSQCKENPTIDCRESPTLSISHVMIGRPGLSQSIADRLPEVSVASAFPLHLNCSV